MDPVGIGWVALGKLDRPRQGADTAVAAAVHQATDPADGMPQRDAWRENIRKFPERQLFESDIERVSERGADEAAVKYQSAAAEVEDLPEWFARESFAPV